MRGSLSVGFKRLACSLAACESRRSVEGDRKGPRPANRWRVMWRRERSNRWEDECERNYGVGGDGDGRGVVPC